MIGIKYIGKRDEHHDNLYGTNLSWTPGQVRNVGDDVAKQMLVHSDTYEEVKPVKGEAAAVIAANDEPIKEAKPLPNLETMDKAALNLYSMQNFGEQFPAKMSEQKMRDNIMNRIQSGR